MSSKKTRRQHEEINDNRRLLELETRLIPPPAQGGELRIHLAYPNHYWVAMSNLGFQAVYSLFAAQSSVAIDRAFLPENPYDSSVFDAKWRTFESSRLLADCDLLATSLSFETDYPHFMRMLRNAGLLFRTPEERNVAADKGFGIPLILAGGTSVTLNPEPVADFADVIFLGEAEEFVPEFTSVLLEARRSGASRIETLKQLSAIEGVYVPQFYKPHYNADHTIAAFSPTVFSPDAPSNANSDELSPHKEFATSCTPKPTRRFVKDISRFPTYSKILTPETEFRSMFLTETGRGCEMGCRFCVAGYIYRPVRKRSEDSIAQSVEIGLENSDAIGFVGAAVSSHKSISKLASRVAERGARASLSSLMSQKVNKELAASLSESEYKTVALAPEAGSERLRRAAGKRVSNEQVVEAARDLAESGIRGFKLYFIVGLPTETDADIDAIAALAKEVREEVVRISRPTGKLAWVVLSVNPFIPKANTPFQWEPMVERSLLEKKIGRISSLVKRTPNLELHFESPKESYFQALMSRGDRRVGELLRESELQGKDWKWSLSRSKKAWIPGGPAADFYVTRRFKFDELLPWEIVDSRLDRDLLKREALRARIPEITDATREAEVASDNMNALFAEAVSY